jgi:four helix bundle protein
MRPENMRMYAAAEALLVEVERLLPRAIQLRPRTADHLERSADSVFFNMAEGIDSFRPKIKITAYEISKKEAGEVRATLRKLVIAKVFTADEISKAMDLAGSIVGMLTSAIKSIEKRLN